jgi:GPH family glycoside/pentoside/hexuronide:cation symporter
MTVDVQANVLPTLPADAEPSQGSHSIRSRRLGLGPLAFYGSGAVVENITTLVVGQFLLFYLTIVCGMSGTAAGLALGVTLVVDAVIDPVVGSMSDNSRLRFGRRHPFMLASILPIVAAFGLLFSVPRDLHGLQLFAYVLGTLLSTRIGLSFFVVPHIALGAELSDNYAERSTIVAWRVLFTFFSGLAVPLLAFGVFMKGAEGQYHAAAYPPFAWSCGAILAASALLSTLGTLGTRSRLHSASEGQRFGLLRFFRETFEVMANRSFRYLFFCVFIMFVAFGASVALTLYANSFFWKLAPDQLMTLGLWSATGLLASVMVTPLLARVLEKRTMAMLGLGLNALAQIAPVVLRLAHVIGPAQAMPTLVIAGIVAYGSGSIANISFFSMMADAADEHELLFGARREGLYFAGITFSQKASSGLGSLIGGLALDFIGFPHGVAPAALSSVPVATVTRLGLVYGPGTGLFVIVATLVLFGYKLNRGKHARVLAELDLRRTRPTAS